MEKLLLVMCLFLSLVGCDSTMADIQKALNVCAENGGLKTYKANHSVICVNGAEFSCPNCD